MKKEDRREGQIGNISNEAEKNGRKQCGKTKLKWKKS